MVRRGTRNMAEANKQIRASDLPAPCRLFLRLAHRVHFGQILKLRVRDGLPVWDPPPRVIHVFKLDDSEKPPRLPADEDFVLKAAAVRFFEMLDHIGSGTVASIEIKHGLPFRIEVETGIGV